MIKAAIVGILLMLLPAILLPFGMHDEAVPVVAAMRILAGQVPYIDFFYPYAPGLPYAVAGLSLLGPSPIIILRIIDLLARGGLAYLFARSTFIQQLPIFSVLSCFIGVLIISSIKLVGYNALQATVISIIILDVWEKVSASCRRVVPEQSNYFQFNFKRFGAGILLGLLALLRHDFAVYVIAVLLADCLFNLFSKLNSLRILGFALANFIAGIAIILIPLVFLLASWSDLRLATYRHLVTFALYEYPKYRATPYPSIFEVIKAKDLLSAFNLALFYLVPSILLAGLVFKILRAAKNKVQHCGQLSFNDSFFGIVLMNQVRVRSDSLHLFPALILSVLTPLKLLSSYLTTFSNQSLRRLHKVILVILFGGITYFFSVNVAPALEFGAWCFINHESYRGCLLSQRLTRQQAVDFVRSITSSAEPIFLLVNQNNRVINNDVGFYALTERLPASRYHELHPGIVTDPTVQKSIIAELEAVQLRILIQQKVPLNPTPWHADGVLLDAYVAEKFTPIAVFGTYKIMRRLDVAD